MAAQKILLPYNFTDIDRKALDFVIRTFGHHKESEVTLIHIYTPLPKIDTDSSTIMGRLSTGMQFLEEELRKKEEALQNTKQYLLDNGFTDRQLNCVFKARMKQVSDEIIETAMKGRFDVIVLNFRPQRITRVFTQSVHNKVISALKDVAVCIVT